MMHDDTNISFVNIIMLRVDITYPVCRQQYVTIGYQRKLYVMFYLFFKNAFQTPKYTKGCIQ